MIVTGGDRRFMGMDTSSDTTTKDVNKRVKEEKLVDLEAMVIFSGYEILKDGSRIFSAED